MGSISHVCLLQPLRCFSVESSDSLCIWTAFSQGVKADETNPWRGGGAWCHQGSRDGDVHIPCSVSASEFHSWFGPGKHKSSFQTRVKAVEVSEAQDLPGCVLWPGQGVIWRWGRRSATASLHPLPRSAMVSLSCCRSRNCPPPRLLQTWCSAGLQLRP